jgi:hypothetical protein
LGGILCNTRIRHQLLAAGKGKPARGGAEGSLSVKNNEYLAGETVAFGLDELELPAVTAAHILTPLELVGVEDIGHTGVVNMARLLQSLDQDCDPENGITIGGEALLAATGMEIDFEDPDFDSKVSNLVANAGQQN